MSTTTGGQRPGETQQDYLMHLLEEQNQLQREAAADRKRQEAERKAAEADQKWQDEMAALQKKHEDNEARRKAQLKWVIAKSFWIGLGGAAIAGGIMVFGAVYPVATAAVLAGLAGGVAGRAGLALHDTIQKSRAEKTGQPAPPPSGFLKKAGMMLAPALISGMVGGIGMSAYQQAHKLPPLPPKQPTTTVRPLSVTPAPAVKPTVKPVITVTAPKADDPAVADAVLAQLPDPASEVHRSFETVRGRSYATPAVFDMPTPNQPEGHTYILVPPNGQMKPGSQATVGVCQEFRSRATRITYAPISVGVDGKYTIGEATPATTDPSQTCVVNLKNGPYGQKLRQVTAKP